ncbi:MAG: PKD domain-containing protein, partial [Bacteroidales bacterium]|nr:PKD domain-containing protein [Bacteroidales bacterium]
VGGSVNFTDNSTGPIDTWEWSFDGGTPSTYSGQTPPEIVYDAPGSYEVSLTVTNPVGSNTETKTDYIVVDYAPDADFSETQTPYVGYCEVQFTDISTGNPTAWAWTFDGGTPATSDEQNPMVTFDVAGPHTVSLTATNDFGQDTETKVIEIEIISGEIEINEDILNIYPNPSDGLIFIDNPAFLQLESIIIYDLKGTEVAKIEHFNGQELLNIDISYLEPGTYILKTITDQRTLSQKINIR